MNVHIPVEDYLAGQGKIVSNNKEYQQENKLVGVVKPMDEKVMSHEYELKEIRAILGSVANNQKETNVQVSKLADSIGKLDLYLEKQNNIELKHNDSVNRLHKRIDENDTAIAKFNELATEYKMTKKDIEMVTKRVDSIESHEGRVVWAILTAVGMAILGLVVN